MTTRSFQRLVSIILCFGALILVGFVDWRISIGMALYGWSLNLDNAVNGRFRGIDYDD